MTRLLKQQVVGGHVRRLRERAGFSLRALAARTDFSPSFISQLENGLVSPSIHSMEKIAGALGVTLATFFANVGPGAGGLVTRAGQRAELASSWSHAAIQALGPMDGRQRLEPLLIALRPGGRSGKHPVPHGNEEFALVMKGRPTLRLGPDEYKLGPGDSVTLLPNELRLWTNPGRAACAVLIVALRGAS